MKNRRIVITAIMLVAVLLMGVGYAAFTDDLEVAGDVRVGANQTEAAEFKQDVYFDNARIDNSATTANNPAKITTSILADSHSDANDKIDISIGETGLNSAGQKAVILVDIVNESTIYGADITLGTPTITMAEGSDDLFDVKCVIDNASIAKSVDASNLSKSTVTITITLLRTPTASEHGTFTVGFTATSTGVETIAP